MSDVDKISMALLAQAGIDHTKVFAVSYQHRVGEHPILTTESYVRSNGEIDVVSTVYEWRQKSDINTPSLWAAWLAQQPRPWGSQP